MMGERRLIAAMEEEITEKIAELDRQTEREVAQIETRAQQAMRETEALESARADQQLTAYRRTKRQQFENEWRERIRHFQFEVAERVFRHLEEALPGVPRREDYLLIWSRLFAEALDAYRQERDDRPVLRVAAADRDRIGDCVREVAGIEVDPSVRDGVELLSPDGRLQVRNTLASRLHRGREEFLKAISDAIQERVQR